jgi:phage terminase large subunit GpA-like protein
MTLLRGFFDGLKPTPVTLVSDWADANRRLSTESAAEPGKWRSMRTPYLKEPLDCLSPNSPIQELYCQKGAQLGFALDLNTHIPTADGWKRMGDMKVGDVVFDETGKPCTVTFVSEVMYNHQCFNLEFSDGTSIIADQGHRWAVWDEKKHEYRKQVIVNTGEIYETHRIRKGVRTRYAIEVAGPLQLPDAELPIPPYTFGAWLGDGNSCSNRITTHKTDAAEMVGLMRAEGAVVELCDKHSKGNCTEILLWPGIKTTASPFSFTRSMTNLGVFRNKGIPKLYLRASAEQRMQLLRGLMDTDGHATKEGYCEFYSTEDLFIQQVYELIASLGLKPVLKLKNQAEFCEVTPGKKYRTKGYIYRITFQSFAENPVFGLSRKADRLRKKEECRHTETTRRRINKVTPVPTRPVRCISVNSDSHLYLAGNSFIPTHNTEGALSILGCYADVAPCPMMYVMPTIEMAKEISENRADPMVENCDVLKLKIKANRERDSGNTKFVKRFPGGSWKFSGANSAASLASKAVRVLLLDEPDRYPLNVDGEGSPITLARQRQVTFGAKKKFAMWCTPNMEHTSVIAPAILKTDCRMYFVPCPACEHMQVLKFANFRYIPGMGDKLTEVHYECEECAHLIEERHKTRMLERGKWIPTKPENISPIKRGYIIPSFYSPIGWLSWVDIIKQFEDSEDDVNKRIVFTNTILAETWKETGEVPAWEELYQRRENYKYNDITDEVCFITSGVDVQKDRLEVQIKGWCKRKVSYSIDYRIIHGDTTKLEVWDKLAEIVRETWKRPDNIELPMYKMAVDTSYNTDQAHAFCRRFDISKVVPIRGSDRLAVPYSSPRAVDTAKSGKKIGRVKVWEVGVSYLKTEVYGALKQKKREDGTVPPGFIHYPQYDEKFFRGLTAEQLISTQDKKGQTKYEWHKKYHFNEPLDTEVYARAAACMIGIDRMKDYHYDAMLNKFGANIRIVKRKTEDPAPETEKPAEQPPPPQKKRKRPGSSIW